MDSDEEEADFAREASELRELFCSDEDENINRAITNYLNDATLPVTQNGLSSFQIPTFLAAIKRLAKAYIDNPSFWPSLTSSNPIDSVSSPPCSKPATSADILKPSLASLSLPALLPLPKVSSLVEGDRKKEAIRHPGEEEDEDGDLGAGMMFLLDTEDDRNDEEGRGLLEGEGSGEHGVVKHLEPGEYSQAPSPWSGREGVEWAMGARTEASVTTSGPAEPETEHALRRC